MKQVFQPEWRTQNKLKRRFYSKYMGWIEKLGYLLVLCVLGAFVFAFNYKVDDVLKADGVKIEPFATSMDAQEPTLIARTLAADFDEVKAGQPLFEIVTGEDNIQRYLRWSKLNDLQQAVGGQADLSGLQKQFTKPPTTAVAAPATGTFRLDAKEGVLEKGATLGRVVNYNDLRLAASLGGQTVANAQPGQTARITTLNMGSADNTIFRGSSSTGDALSGKLVGAKVKEVLQKELQGAAIQLRDDVPLAIQDVGELQVDAHIRREPGSGGTAIPLDPPANYVLKATVIEGVPMATVQIADLPKEIRDRAIAAVKEALLDKSIQDPNGSQSRLTQADDINLVAKLNAKGLAKDATTKLNGTMTSRTFDAKLKIDSPPAFLIQAVRDADRAGNAITARVELVTGMRPIAFILLKKS